MVGSLDQLPPEIYAAIKEAVLAPTWLSDNNAADRLHEAYTEDGRLISSGGEVFGRLALMRHGQKRKASIGRTTRHAVTNIRISPIDVDVVEVASIATVYRFNGQGLGSARPATVADFFDRLVKQADGWKIKERRIVVRFETEPRRIATASTR